MYDNDLNLINAVLAGLYHNPINGLRTDSDDPDEVKIAANYKLWYEEAFCFTDYNWRFATEEYKMEKVADEDVKPTVSGFFSIYKDSEDAGEDYLRRYGYHTERHDRIKWLAKPGTKYIQTNIPDDSDETLYALYMAVTPVAKFPPAFTRFVKNYFTHEIATLLAKPDKWVETALNLEPMLYREAQREDIRNHMAITGRIDWYGTGRLL